MIVIDVNVANTQPPQNFKNASSYEFLPVKIGCDFDCGDDCPPCGSGFSYIVRDGDVIYLQYRFADNFNEDHTNPEYGWQLDEIEPFWLRARIMNSDGTVAIDDITLDSVGGENGIREGYAVGYDGGSIQGLNIRVNSALIDALNSDCFYIQIDFCEGNPDLEYLIIEGIGALPPYQNQRPGSLWVESGVVYVATPTGWAAIANQPQDGDIAWIVSLGQFLEYDDGDYTETETSVNFNELQCGDRRVCNTDMFSVKTCSELLCFDSFPTRVFDCNGKYFGDKYPVELSSAGGDFLYQEKFCIEGSIELTGFNVTRTTTSRGRVTEENSEAVYRMRAIVPEKVAKRIKDALLPQNFTINGLSFDTYDSIQKDNDESSDWHVDIELRTKDCDNVGDCV